ncbi:hypothetical protein PBI_NESBITT_16 [Streptomyces phage Nesbitt]|uniref:Uncharacterized protein n=3 Tax=Caudoviricetes TaxID=2731619 RepID=A0A0K1Y594_9CAUD|nr:hypothetical protein AVV13_gp15 [Streptomyces phage SF1]YP_009796738.1 hypothetical protein HOS57_gp16 [Streptomyces phage AbbeyMikolon]AKY02164.1 hypothetical protein SF1_150 [Streptomyces phage SF1]AUG87088.1 hypothetical protein SEA_ABBEYMIKOLON_16 [Streptomyces phage AbbeyMikolon]AVO22273.1 hypothetical protein PBI_NESBITT_16 [Streptomyces phage Nesbitt]
MSTPAEGSIVITDPYEIPQTEETVNENGDTVVTGYPSDGAIPVGAPADTTGDQVPGPPPGAGDVPMGA